MENQQIVTEFAQKFDPQIREHVVWLKNVHLGLSTADTTKCHIPSLINQNPMEIAFPAKEMMNWVHVHFALNFKYAKAVLIGNAYIPQA
jgi:hypothetical protein